MKQKRWTKAGREMKEKNPSMFTGGRGKQRHFKGGAHTPDTQYRRSDRRNEERRAQRGDYED